MEKHQYTNCFNPLNFNLKRIIFSFLDICDQRKIYWLSKKFRSLLPASPLDINITSFKKRSILYSCPIKEFDVLNIFKNSFKYALAILELPDGTIACVTTVHTFNLKIKNRVLELENFLWKTPVKDKRYQHTLFCCHGDQILCTDGHKELSIRDKNFKIISEIRESNEEGISPIFSICNISQSSFAVWKINFSQGPESSLTIFHKEPQGNYLYSCLHILSCSDIVVNHLTYHSFSGQDYLLFSSNQRIFAFNLPTTELIVLEGHNVMSITPLDDRTFTCACYPSVVTSIISLDDRTFASACFSGKIKIWKFHDTFSIACEKTIDAYEDKSRVILTPLSKHYMLSYLYGIGQELKLFEYKFTGLSDEFKLWDVKTFELLKTFKNDSNIERLIALKDNSIVIYSEDDKVSLWQISE